MYLQMILYLIRSFLGGYLLYMPWPVNPEILIPCLLFVNISIPATAFKVLKVFLGDEDYQTTLIIATIVKMSL